MCEIDFVFTRLRGVHSGHFRVNVSRKRGRDGLVRRVLAFEELNGVDSERTAPKIAFWELGDAETGCL